MSHPTLRSAFTKRKANGNSLTDGRKKNRLRFAIEDVLVPKPSLRRPPTLQRDKSFYDKEDDNFSNKVNIDPTVSIPQDKQGPTNAIQSHHESGPNNLPLNSSSNGQKGAIFNESSPTNNDRVALLPQDQDTDLSTSSDFQPNITWPSPPSSSVPIVSFHHIEHVSNVYFGLFKATPQSRRRAKNDIDIVGDDQQPDPTVEANQQHIRIIGDDQQPSETVETDHQPDNTADYTVDADRQAMPSFSVPDCHKTLKIKLFDVTNIIPDEIMDVSYDDTVEGLKDLIILSFLKEETLDPRRIRLTFISHKVLASTSPQGRIPNGYSRIREKALLGDIFGDEGDDHLDYEDDVKVHVEVQILPSPK